MKTSEDIKIDVGHDRHAQRYMFCLSLLIDEIRENGAVNGILDKYGVKKIGTHGVNLDFPDDFDQKYLPEELR